MPITPKRRGRIVSFRVSEEEYLNLCRATEAAGARSISDFARHVACHHSLVLSAAPGAAATPGPRIAEPKAMELHPAASLTVEVSKLRKRVDEIALQMQAVVRRVNRGA